MPSCPKTPSNCTGNMSEANAQGTFQVREAREIIKDLLQPNPRIYWLDFLFHITLGWGAFVLAVEAESFSANQLLYHLVATLALFRASVFNHELAHIKKKSFQLFRMTWNILSGFPLLVPTFLYHGVHNNHHKPSAYGTKGDGEYSSFALDKRYKIILYVLSSFTIPPLLFFRHAIMTPLSYLNKTWRNFLWERCSSLSINMNYKRPPPAARDDGNWQIQEFFTSVFAITVTACVVVGLLPLKVLILWYTVQASIHFINSLRTLGAHCYRNPADRMMDLSEQFLDSVNVPGNPITTPLWAPVGLRYHATHHLFPDMPYHSLSQAHHRLMERLSDNSIYKETLRSSLWNAITRLWREAG